MLNVTKLDMNVLSTDTLQERFCIEFYKIYSEFPKPEFLDRTALLKRINMLQLMSLGVDNG